MREEFPEKTKRVIQDRAGNRCSNPACRILTSGPNAHPERSTKIGVAAHISGASPGGARYNSNLTSDQRRSAENGIWLCQNCAHYVDTDNQNYPVELLNGWKAQAEREADDETKGRSGKLPRPQPTGFEEEEEGWGCPFCGTVVGFERSVCLGCNAEVIPGLTRAELQENKQIGGLAGGGIAVLLLVMLPNWIRSSLHWNVEILWGLGPYGLGLGAVMVFVGAFAVPHFSEQQKLKEPPRFFRHTFK